MVSDKALLGNIVIRCFSAPLHWTGWSNFPFYYSIIGPGHSDLFIPDKILFRNTLDLTILASQLSGLEII